MSTDAVTFAQQRLRIAQGRLNFAQAGGNPDEIRVATATYLARAADLAQAQAAASGTPPENSAPASNPTPEPEEDTSFSFLNPSTWFGSDDDDTTTPTSDPVVNDYSEFGDVARDLATLPPVPQEPAPATDPVVNDYSEFGDVARDLATPPPVPQEPAPATDPVVNEYDELSNIERDLSVGNTAPVAPASDFATYTDTELSQQIASTYSALNSLEALPTQQRRQVQAQIDALKTQYDGLVAELKRRNEQGIKVPPDETVKPKQPAEDPYDPGFDEGDAGETIEPPEERAQINQAALDRLKNQAAIRATRSPASDGDWRFRLQLAPNAGYLYKDGSNTLMAPIRATDGIVFPYTPRIDISYIADYNQYAPTHSNYRHYFYQGSRVGEVNMTADFTAQDTSEANYLLAVITFLKSASKMFYGQDADRGSPPPVLFLTGLGEFQFNEHPCIISQFNYNLPDNVQYIRANATQINGQTNTLQSRRPLVNNGGPQWAGSTVRKIINGLPNGAENKVPSAPILGQNNPTYVPTKLSINLQLLPVQSRREVSQGFSLESYSKGNLLRGGYW